MSVSLITVTPGRPRGAERGIQRDADRVSGLAGLAGLSARRRQIRGLAWLLSAVAAGMLAWIVILGVSLPSTASTREWRLVWIGFDVGELAALLLTLWAIYRSRQIAIPAALISGTLFVCDAWFDVVLSWGTSGWWLSVASAIFVEVPLAAVLWFSARSLVHAVINNQLPAGPGARPARLRDLELIPAERIEDYGSNYRRTVALTRSPLAHAPLAHDPMRFG
jgi:hypothetical protein